MPQTYVETVTPSPQQESGTPKIQIALEPLLLIIAALHTLSIYNEFK